MGIALVLGLISVGSARADDLYVGPGETYTTIQSAVAAGTYLYLLEAGPWSASDKLPLVK